MANPAFDWNASLAAAVDKAAPSVVQVSARRGPGSAGIAWSEDLVITSRRAIRRDDDIGVYVGDSDRRSAELLGHDAGTDLALLRVEGGGLVPLELIDPDELRVGHAAIALGRPGRSVRASFRIIGVVGPGIRTPGGGTLDRYIETDRGLPIGFSGGPLIDLEGRGLGMNSRAILRGADIVVPAPTLRRVVGELLEHGSVRRGYLGVGVYRVRLPKDAAKSLGRNRGALVVAVEDDTPAAAAGMLLGDVIVEVAGEPVLGPRELRDVLEDLSGKDAAARLLRAGEFVEVNIAIGERS